MKISMQPIDLPFTLGSKLWVNHNLGELTKPYHLGEIIEIKLEGFSFYKNETPVATPKPEYRIEVTRISCRIVMDAERFFIETYDYWLNEINSILFLTEEDLLSYRKNTTISLR